VIMFWGTVHGAYGQENGPVVVLGYPVSSGGVIFRFRPRAGASCLLTLPQPRAQGFRVFLG
jgi:hypothetical protein